MYTKSQGSRLSLSKSDELPARNRLDIPREISNIVYLLVSSNRDIEPALTIEAAKSLVTGAVQIIEGRGGFLRMGVAVREQMIAAGASQVRLALGVLHRHLDQPPFAKPTIEIDGVRIDAIQ
jgi:hypothetical protein